MALNYGKPSNMSFHYQGQLYSVPDGETKKFGDITLMGDHRFVSEPTWNEIYNKNFIIIDNKIKSMGNLNDIVTGFTEAMNDFKMRLDSL